MINKIEINELGLELLEEYFFDENHRSFVFRKDKLCIIVDDNICNDKEKTIFNYSKYCEMQNKYMAEYDKLYRFNWIDNSCYNQIKKWINI